MNSHAMQPTPGDGEAEPADAGQDPTSAAGRADPASAHPVRPQAWMSDLQPADSCSGFDPSRAHPARVYAYWLGGKDHFPADRKAAEQVMRSRPQVVAGARANRAFLARLVRYLAAECGIRQFLDLGTVLPAPGSTIEVAQAVAPDARVVYVDNDPLVLIHARALLTGTGPSGQQCCDYLDADVRDTATILTGAAGTLDFHRPIAVLMLAVLHFIPDADGPQRITAALAGALAPGSYLAISHLTADFAPGPVTAGVTAYNTLVPAGITARTHTQITALFAGLPLISPGVVPVTEWRAALTEASPSPVDVYAGVARIPGDRR